MKICVLASEFYPIYGGVGRVFTNMCKVFSSREEKLYIFNKYYKGKNIYSILDKTIKYNLKDAFNLCRKKKYFFYFMYSIWKIISDKNLKFYFRLNMLLYLLIKPKILVKVLKNVLSLHPYLKKIEPDLIFISACDSVLMPVGFILSKLMKRKLICVAHGTDFLVHTHYSLKSRFLNAIDKIILTCNQMKILIKKINHLKDDKLTIIPLGLYLPDYEIGQKKEEIRKELKIQENDFVLISVGRHAPRKNFQIVIKAMKLIKERYPHLKFKYFLIGEGPETINLRDLTKNLNLEEEVLFVGSVNDKIKNKYLKASDLFIMPSIASNKTIEGFGIVFLEANFFKIPVIGTLSGGIIDAIDHNKSGLLIKPNNLDELVNAILYLYNHEEERIKMGEYGHNRVINKFNWNLLVNDYIRVFENVIKE